MELLILRKIPLFANLTNQQLEKVAALCAERRVPAGEFIFKEDDIGDEMYIITDGRVRISKSIPGIGEEALAILEQGTYFGEMALVEDSPRSADARAHTSVTLSVIKKDALRELIYADKELGYELLWTFVKTLSARLRETNEKIKAFFAISRFG